MIDDQVQPAPTPNDNLDVWLLTIAAMHRRRLEGIKRYGCPVQAGNGRDALWDAAEESMDKTVHLFQAIEERNAVVAELRLIAEKVHKYYSWALSLRLETVIAKLTSVPESANAKKKCEGCGGEASIKVRLTNGGLDDFNRKNPELKLLPTAFSLCYWAWQGDGSDHLESLTCPVLIWPESLMEMIGKAAIKPTPESASH